MSTASNLFCPACESILDLPGNEDNLRCAVCAYVVDTKSLENIEIVTTSRRDPFQQILEQLEKTTSKAQSATIKERCPKCFNPEMEFHTAQLRSADEGQTVFYSCPKCFHKYSVNN